MFIPRDEGTHYYLQVTNTKEIICVARPGVEEACEPVLEKHFLSSACSQYQVL